jgi:hypothetical protein
MQENLSEASDADETALPVDQKMAV